MMEDEKGGSDAASKNAGVPVVLECLLVFKNPRALLPRQWLGRFKGDGVTAFREERWWTRDSKATQAMSHSGWAIRRKNAVT
jgi:hypothetical protein